MRDRRSVFVFLLGLALCGGIWLAVPYNNFALNNSFVSDGYLPEIVLLCIVFLVLAVNPLLRRFLPGAALSHRHLALLVGMLLFGAVLPSNGLFRFFPHSLALETEGINRSPVMAPAIRDSALPPSLFPDPIGFDIETPASSQLVQELDPGASIPWAAWVSPLLSWGTVIVAFWILMIGMGMMVYPQWRHVERLSFPLLRVYHALIDEPEPGRAFPAFFRSRVFWVGAGLVLFVHSLNGLALFTDGAFPELPIGWNVSGAFSEGIGRYAPGIMVSGRIYFLFIGLAYFMPNRFSFSIWFTLFASGLLLTFAREHMPMFRHHRLYDAGAGALIVMALGVAWLGRRHYLQVLRAAFGRGAKEGEATTDALAGRLFLGGAAAMLAWFVWAGAGVPMALILVVMGIVIMLMVTRIVAETGLTYVWIIGLAAQRIITLFPQRWLTVSSVFLQQAHYILANRASAVSAAAMTVLALGLNRSATPTSRRRLAGVGLLVLVLGLVVCGAVHLRMGYTLSTSYDGVNHPITGRGARLMGLGPVQDVAIGREFSMDRGQLQAIVYGAVLAALMLLLCARFPGWPLHPIGMLFVHSSIGWRLGGSMFLGWAIKTLLVKYGGARAYRASMPFFLGLIVGEMLANTLWTLVPVLEILFGADPAMIRRLVIFQYT